MKRRGSLHITGEIAEYYQDKQLLYVPIVHFMFQEQEYQIKLDKGFRRKIGDIGGLLEIYFRPGKLDSVKLATDKKDIWHSIIFILVGAVLVFFITV